MRNIEKRILRQEKLVAKKIQAAKVCNCRSTSFHNAECLEALLMNIPWLCPVHGLRQLALFWWVPSWVLLRYTEGEDDNRFCPCPPHPWRTHVWKGLYRTGRRTNDDRRAKSDAARKAWQDLPPKPPVSREDGKRRLQEYNRRIDAVLERYEEAVQQWIDSGRQPPDPRQIFRQARTGESTNVAE